jgi:glucarate dehydratase
MKIKEMIVTPIALSDPPLLNIEGMHAPYALRTIVELVTEDNISGVGEVPGGERVTTALNRSKHIVIGSDPFHWNRICDELQKKLRPERDDPASLRTWKGSTLPYVCSAIEVALWDIIGKVVNRPVCDLMGGAVRERVAFAAYIFFKQKGAGGRYGLDENPAASGWEAARQGAALDEDGIVAMARAMVHEYGFKSIKLKGGVFGPAREVSAVMALRKAFGRNVPLRLDPNASWSPKTAIEWGRKMEGVLEYFEDPAKGQDGMAKVRRAVSIPLATNMCTTAFDHLPASIRLHSEDIILADHHKWGGMRATIELARICSTFGRGLSMHSNSHLGVSLAAMVHLAAATPNLTFAVDTHYPWQAEEIIVGGRFHIEDGSLPVRKESGLGVELDRKALQELHEQYVACGIKERNDEVEMQKIYPDWRFQEVRW